MSLLTVETQVEEVPVCKVVLHDGHEGGHLTEEQDPVIGGVELGQDAVQKLKLARCPVQIVTGRNTGKDSRSNP